MLRRLLSLVLIAAAVVPVAIGAGAPVASAEARTSGAVSVRDFGATGAGTADDTAAFRNAMTEALKPAAVRFSSGPTGNAQSVVYVPPGEYRLLNLTFPNNLRLEVDAGAVLKQAGGRTATAPSGYSNLAPSLILWDGPAGSPVRNVSVVGVGSATGGRKAVADPVAPGWSIAESFTFDLDPATTNANNQVAAVLAINVDGFQVSRAFSIQNDSQPTINPRNNAEWWPSTRKVALMMRARRDTPIGGPYYDPHNGLITDWYNVNGPRGFGPTQITSAHDVTFRRIYSEGGTALRLETDSSEQAEFGGEVRGIAADGIVGVRCNRAVALAPHAQHNANVAITNVRATGCYQGVAEAIDKKIDPALRGSFTNSTISGVVVEGGDGAQLPIENSGGKWSVGRAYQAFGRESLDTWALTYATGSFSCSGTFSEAAASIRTPTGTVRPNCTVVPSDPPPSASLQAPRGLSATAITRSKIRVNWQGALGATSYRVARSTTAGGPYTTVIETTDKKYVDLRLTRNTKYFYVVYSVSTSAVSPASIEVSATTLRS